MGGRLTAPQRNKLFKPNQICNAIVAWLLMTNPYQPPLADLSTHGLPKGSGPWRHKNQLVIRVPSASQMNRCLVSNEECQNKVELTFTEIPAKAMWVLGFGVAGVLLAQHLFGKQTTIRLPLKQSIVDESQAAHKRAWKYVILSMLAFFLAVVAFVFAMASGVNDNVASAILFPFLFMPIVALGWLFFSFIRQTQALKLTQVKDDFAWVKGVNAELLAGLPEWGETA